MDNVVIQDTHQNKTPSPKSVILSSSEQLLILRLRQLQSQGTLKTMIVNVSPQQMTWQRVGRVEG